MTEPARRRRRPAVSCTLCRRRKLRCNREFPCSNCLRSKSGHCFYDGNQPQSSSSNDPDRQQNGLETELQSSLEATTAWNGKETTSTRSPSSAAHGSTSEDASSREIQSMRSKIRQLENQLAKSRSSSSHHSPSTSNKGAIELPSDYHLQHDSRLFGDFEITANNTTHKARMFGKSHWINVMILFGDLVQNIDLLDGSPKLLSTMKKCKALGRVIKAKRAPEWPALPSTELPPKEVADELVECYLRTIESVYRILHVPSFRRDYEAIWTSDKPPDMAFMVQLKLVLALGATTYDDCFSMRTDANRWLLEGQTWFARPEFKSRLNIQSLQSNALLILAAECVGNSGEAVWISAGTLLRTAMYMGLHRDPSRLPSMPFFIAEMRRRLFDTLLELALQSSLTAGASALISLDEFDIGPPGNFDDEQLTADNPVPKPDHEWTHMSAALALRKTFPARLAIAKHLNSVSSSGNHEDTLSLDVEIRAQYRMMCQTLQASGAKGHPGLNMASRPFSLRMLDFILCRYIQALHMPFFGPAMEVTKYAFSRKMVVEMSLKLWCNAFSFSAISSPNHDRGEPEKSPGQDDLARLAICSSGFFRTVAVLAVLVIAAELKGQFKEQESLGPSPLRRDLLAVLEEGKTWSMCCLKAGETNAKGYLVFCLVAAQVNSMMLGSSPKETAASIIAAGEEAADVFLGLFEEAAGQSDADDTVRGLDQMSLDIQPQLMEDWSFLMPSGQMDSGSMEQMNWMFGYDLTPGPFLS